ncbi:MAG: hypothetical protein HC897_02305 [Thermoanaerobaculia bacterium]|nr:hypothetical protein [Thermoanaerobaculia bacterium]
MTSCTATRWAGHRIDYSFEIQTFHSPETVTGHGFAGCDNLGKKIAIRYLEADPFVSQLDRPWPWAFALFVGLVLTLAALPLIWPALNDRAMDALCWCICLIVMVNLAANAYRAQAGIDVLTSEQLLGVVFFAVVFNPYPFYRWVRKRIKARKEARSDQP